MTLMTYKPRISIFDEFNRIFNGINTYDSNKLYNSKRLQISYFSS